MSKMDIKATSKHLDGDAPRIHSNSRPESSTRVNDAQVFKAHIRLLQAQTKPAVLLNLPLILITLVLLWPSTQHPWLLVWAGSSTIISLLRLALFKRFDATGDDDDAIKRWSSMHLLVTAITGLLWGSLALFLLQDISSYQQNYIILLIIGLTGTSISVNSSYFPNFLAFIIPAIVPMEFVLLSLDKEIYNGFSYLLIVYLFILIKSARAAERNVRHTITLRLENQSLVNTLRRSNAELYQEVELRTNMEAQLREAKEVAEQASQSKSEFISRISHELRTPLTAILGFSGILSHSQKLEESVRADIGKINKAGQHLLSLIDDLLDISRIEKGNLTISQEPIKLDDLLEETRSLITPLAEKSEVELIITTPPQTLILNADYMRLKQVLLNLLSNAVKYNRSGGRIELKVETVAAERVRISVIDTGVGIAAEKLDQLFEPYNRLGAENTSVLGTGIGMTISKQIIELMHGEIGVQSELGKGTQFWIELPLSSEWEAKILDTDFLVDGLYEVLPDGFVCLYVEDNPNNVALIRRMMEHMGNIKLISAPSAELGIELAEAHRTDLILMDINLPGMNGYSALQHLRQSELGKRLPIIALSANSGPDEVERGLAAGFDDYLTKPVDMETLAATIARVYQHYKTTELAPAPDINHRLH